ncbi:peptide-methionine (S)-S-oxide reductase MsrA [Cyanobium sp. WAJ14-Wanaka]|uniref:peptide-methionine (S)-S-oxide reductase MsrA n=1 Tax=Cyanobium sp. WAJ14-Wanaka TaxID=2823725 RepID=UPI0020CF61D4|nr:peptide-methionine (S)-S-oxide reductase MsrA [Cyanobium sp. WAJ14-Wanaka]MCP9774659.1 peptide-methionine (S)-S-oxide reductase MsrA [Cyanobium sp. WAJ14-Wanaka]
MSSPLHAVLGTPINTPPGPGQGEAVFGCGCFWGAEKGFWRLPGVFSTAVGYAGGHLENPDYGQVCSGQTGHSEVVRVVWDTNQVDFSDLLKLFWECHDPTQGDRQGNDRGSQYRSVIYVNSPELMALVEASRQAYQSLLDQAGLGSITTEVKADQHLYYAETYHQQYLAKPGSRPYCSAQPTGQRLSQFEGANFKLDPRVWEHYDWAVSHCVLRGDNSQIRLAVA